MRATSHRASRWENPRLSAASTSPYRSSTASSPRLAAIDVAVIAPPRTMPPIGTRATPCSGTTPDSRHQWQNHTDSRRQRDGQPNSGRTRVRASCRGERRCNEHADEHEERRPDVGQGGGEDQRNRSQLKSATSEGTGDHPNATEIGESVDERGDKCHDDAEHSQTDAGVGYRKAHGSQCSPRAESDPNSRTAQNTQPRRATNRRPPTIPLTAITSPA